MGCVLLSSAHYNSDFTGTGALLTFDSNKKTLSSNLDTSLDPDTFILVDSSAYVVDQDTGSVRVYDLSTFAVVSEISTGNSEAPNTTSRPQQVARSGTKLYVTLAGNNAAHAIGVLDFNAKAFSKFISLQSQVGDTDGPEPFAIYACNNLLYVTQQNYIRMGQDVTYLKGSIAVIDPSSDTVTATFDIGKNPSNIVPIGSTCTDVLVATTGSLASAADGTGGVEHVDLAQKKSLGTLALDTALGGRPNTVDVASPTLAFAAVYYDPMPNGVGKVLLSSTKVVAFNATTGALLGDVTPKAGSILYARVSPDQQLYVGVSLYGGTVTPGKLDEGVYYGPADGTMVGATPLKLGQAPSAIAFETNFLH
jgi:hypothetical protein